MIINPFAVKDEKKNNDETIEKFDFQKVSDEITRKIIAEQKNNIIKGNREIIEEKIVQTLAVEFDIKEKVIIEKISKEIIDKIFGYGILQKYITKEFVSDIRVVEYNRIYIKEKGVWHQIEESFESKEKLEEYIRFCALKNNVVINYETPTVVFSDKINALRIEAGIEPVNVVSPNLVIRIHPQNKMYNLTELCLEAKMLSKYQCTVLSNAVNKKQNVVICGKGGSGKTTLMRALLEILPNEIAITTNEETAELYLNNKNCIQRECINNRATDKNVDLEKLSKQALVMSNDVIIIGELKGAEANTFFDSISTGHMGMATVHADCAKNAIDRLITLIKKDSKAIQYTESFLRRFLASSIDYIVYMEDFKIKEIATICYDEETNKLSVHQIKEAKK